MPTPSKRTCERCRETYLFYHGEGRYVTSSSWRHCAGCLKIYDGLRAKTGGGKVDLRIRIMPDVRRDRRLGLGY